MSWCNWLVFGNGPHVYRGKNFVLMLFRCVLGKYCYKCRYYHAAPSCDEINMFTTISPKEDIVLEKC